MVYEKVKRRVDQCSVHAWFICSSLKTPSDDMVRLGHGVISPQNPGHRCACSRVPALLDPLLTCPPWAEGRLCPPQAVAPGPSRRSALTNHRRQMGRPVEEKSPSPMPLLLEGKTSASKMCTVQGGPPTPGLLISQHPWASVTGHATIKMMD